MPERDAKSERDANHVGMSTERLKGLSDGIFAFAMTLLVVTIDLPQKQQIASESQLNAFILAQGQEIFNFALSFVLLAVFWVAHHEQFSYVVRTDRRHMWLNIMLLLFVAGMPYTTSLVGDFPNAQSVELIFSGHLLAVSSLLAASWAYATLGHRLVRSDLSPYRISLGWKRSLVIPGLSVLAMGVAFFRPGASSFVYLLAPVALWLLPLGTGRGEETRR